MSRLQISESPGYRLYSFPELGADAEVLLPYDLVDQLELEQIERETARREKVKGSLAVEEEQRIARERARASESQLPPPPPGRPLSPLEAARALTVPGYVPQPSSDTIAVFDWGAAQKRFHAQLAPIEIGATSRPCFNYQVSQAYRLEGRSCS